MNALLRNAHGRKGLGKGRGGRARGLAFLVVVGALSGSTCAPGAELVLERSAVQKLVQESLFKDEQKRFYLQKGDCYAYLENPEVSIFNGRVAIQAHLSSRLGFGIGGACLGAGFSSDLTVSGVPKVNGTKLVLESIDIGKVKDKATQVLVDNVLKQQLPKAIDYDVLPPLRKMLEGSKEGFQASVDSLVLSGLTAPQDRLVIKFDFKLSAR